MIFNEGRLDEDSLRIPISILMIEDYQGETWGIVCYTASCEESNSPFCL